MDVCTLYFAIQLHALLIENSCFLTTNSSADFQVLQVKMPQELQNEEKSSQSEVDEGIQATAWEGYDTGRRNITSVFLIPPHEFAAFVSFKIFKSHSLIAILLKDSTFEFERKRNRPERYDRNLAENTLKAIKKIDKVRVRREAKHHEMRFVSSTAPTSMPLFFSVKQIYVLKLSCFHVNLNSLFFTLIYYFGE